MEVTITIAKVIFLGFVVIDSSNGKVTKRRIIYEKLVGIGSMMENYDGCDRSCNSHNLG